MLVAMCKTHLSNAAGDDNTTPISSSHLPEPNQEGTKLTDSGISNSKFILLHPEPRTTNLYFYALKIYGAVLLHNKKCLQ
jgi:hypothetical protein